MSMRQFAKTALSSGAAFGLCMSFCFIILFGLRKGLLLGAIAGVLFGIAIAMFVFIQSKSELAQISLEEAERLLKDGPANHFVRGESVGGWLFLTNKRLVFKSHQMNVQVHKLSLPLEQLTEARPVMTLKIIPNGLRVATQEGTAEQFVVEARREWVRAINEVVLRA
jgi:hypothetical protein